MRHTNGFDILRTEFGTVSRELAERLVGGIATIEEAKNRSRGRLLASAAGIIRDEEDDPSGSLGNAADAECGPDDFFPTPSQKPRGYHTVLSHAEEVLLDRFRAALQLHYDSFTSEEGCLSSGSRTQPRVQRRAAA